MTERTPQNIEDVRALLAEVRASLIDINKMDMTEEGAEILFEPLLSLNVQLNRLRRDIEKTIQKGEAI